MIILFYVKIIKLIKLKKNVDLFWIIRFNWGYFWILAIQIMLRGWNKSPKRNTCWYWVYQNRLSVYQNMEPPKWACTSGPKLPNKLKLRSFRQYLTFCRNALCLKWWKMVFYGWWTKISSTCTIAFYSR